MSTLFSIARTESRRIFVSPLAWAVLAVLQLIVGFVFVSMLFEYLGNPGGYDQFTGMADYIGGGLYGFATILLLLIMPLLTMRLFAEERKSGSLTLLLASPAS
jgi:ABC-2 type transport system permease protein